MSEYTVLVESLEKRKCKICAGLGKVDDAGFGDIYYKEYICPSCNGTGLKETYEQD